MKNLIIILAVLFFSTSLNSKLNAIPADSCLWVPTHVTLESTLHGEMDNSDSTLYIDTCGLYLIDPNFYRDSLGNHITNPNLDPQTNNICMQYKRYYSKSVWHIKFNLPEFAFDTTNIDLNTLFYFTVDELDDKNIEIFEGFQNLKSNYGNIKFWLSLDSSLTIKQALSSEPYSGYYYIETEKLVNSVEFSESIKNLPNVSCDFGSYMIYPISDIYEIQQNNSFIRISTDYNDLEIVSKEILNNVLIYSSDGDLILDINNSQFKSMLNTFNFKIEISYLPTGVYFIKVNNSMHKFIVVR